MRQKGNRAEVIILLMGKYQNVKSCIVVNRGAISLNPLFGISSTTVNNTPNATHIPKHDAVPSALV
jgi:hypothetical protein